MRALITGITGQDGSYLAELLLDKGYEVHGVVRDPAKVPQSRIAHLAARPEAAGHRLFIHAGEIAHASTWAWLGEAPPAEVYHLAAQSHSGLSFQKPEETCEVNGMGTLRLLERLRNLPDPPRFFHASSSEIFGRPDSAPQDERTPLRPVTPYGCSKAFATQLTTIYRNNHGLFAVNGILYNHESPRRGSTFVTQKICAAAAAIKEGRQQALTLGNTAAQRDWGDAREYVRGMWLALQHTGPEDYVFATGVLHSVQDVVKAAFDAVGLDWREHVRHDPALMRPDDPSRLVGNAAKAERLLGWKPAKPFQSLIAEMVRAQLGK